MFVKLSQLVADYISQQDGTQQDQFRITNIARRGVRMLNMDIIGEIRTQVLTMNPNKTVDLPSDYIHFTKIGTVNAKGEIATFRQNTDMALASDRSGGRFQLPASATQALASGSSIYYNYINQGAYYQLLGLGSGSSNVGEYRIDEANRIICFSSSIAFSQIVMEYLSDGTDADNGDAQVDERAYEAMIGFIRWKDYEGKTKKHGLGEIVQARKDYFNERELLRLRLHPLIKSVVNEKIRDSIKAAPKA